MARSRILVVDDEKKTVESIRLYLEHGGFDVVTAYNGTQALEELEAAAPDLVLLDVMLPRMDGLEVCRRIRAASRVPIIMVTARVAEEDRLAGLDLGADDYVTGGNRRGASKPLCRWAALRSRLCADSGVKSRSARLYSAA